MKVWIFCILLFSSMQAFAVNGCQDNHFSCIISSHIPYVDLVDFILYVLLGLLALNISYFLFTDFSFLLSDMKPSKFYKRIKKEQMEIKATEEDEKETFYEEEYKEKEEEQYF